MFMLPVSRLWPTFSAPTALISGQSLCSGWGSDVMSRRRFPLLTKRTRVPGGTVNSFGLTPFEVIVKVNGLLGEGVVGVLPPPPPQAAAAHSNTPTAK